MGRSNMVFLALFLCVLIQAEFSFGENVSQPGSDGTQTQGQPEEKAKILAEIRKTIAEKEQLRKERQTFLKAEREKNLVKTEDLKKQFMDEEARQKKENEAIEAAKKSWQADSLKIDQQIINLQRQARRARFGSPERKKLEKQVEDKKRKRIQLKNKHNNWVKKMKKAREVRVAALQAKSDKVMAERAKTESEVEREMAEMDGIMKAFDFELMELKSELQKFQS